MSKEKTKGVKEKFSAAKKKKDDITKYYNDIAMKNDAINKLKDAERKKKKNKKHAKSKTSKNKGSKNYKKQYIGQG
jgi:hypothetical protein